MNATSGVAGMTQPRLSADDVRRRLVEPVAQDREVVRAEVPDDAHVGLVQPEVHAARRDEVDLAELAGADQVADHVDRRAVEERVPGHQDEAALVGELDQLDRLAADAASGFSTKTCLPASSAASASA